MRFLELLRELIAPYDWQIGPIVWLNWWPHSYSIGMPARPKELGPDAIEFTLDGPGQEVHYVTERVTSANRLTIGDRFSLRVTVQADPGVRFVPLDKGRAIEGEATMSLYLEHEANEWDAQPHRWWAVETPLTVGVHILTAPVDAPFWTAVQTRGTSEELHDTMAHLARRGLTFGGPGGRGHGVSATGSARITVEVIPPSELAA